MEPEERLTKRERREQARRERKQKEQHREREGRTRRSLVVVGTIVGVIAVGALIWFTQEEPAEDGIQLEPAAAGAGAEAAGCTRPDMQPPISAAHIDEEGAPPPEQIYPDRPSWGGPHFGNISPVRITDEPLDERLVLHNLEHGAVLAWYDPDAADPADVAALEEWADERNRAGFQQRGGAGILVSPYPEQPLPTGGAIAFRAWLAAVDCDAFDVDAADAFLALHYGTAGQGPEAPAYSPYPQDVLVFASTPDEDPFSDQPIGEADPDVDEPEDAEPHDDPDDVDEADAEDQEDGGDAEEDGEDDGDDGS